jgi:hypothetical protein
MSSHAQICLENDFSPTHMSTRMEADRIYMELDSDSTFYYILTRIPIRIRIFSNTNAKRIPRIRIFTRYIG